MGFIRRGYTGVLSVMAFNKRAFVNTPTGDPPSGTERRSTTPFNNSWCSTTASSLL